MIKHCYKGKLILFEGLDEAGKTTVAKKLLPMDENFIYCKAIDDKNFWGRLAKRFSKTPLFLVELFYLNYFIIKPALKNGKIILQDRYFFSIASHVPDIYQRINKLAIKIIEPYFIEPDLIFYLDVSISERLGRLRLESSNRFHQILIDNPELIVKRGEKFKELLTPYRYKTFNIDTTNIAVSKTVSDVVQKIDYFFKSRFDATK